MEAQLGAHMLPLIAAGRVLMRQANLSEHQQQVLALKTNVLMGYDEVVRKLRPLDRLDTLARAGAISGPSGVNRTYLDEWAEGDDYNEDAEEETNESDSVGDEEFLQFEDKEYTMKLRPSSTSKLTTM